MYPHVHNIDLDEGTSETMIYIYLAYELSVRLIRIILVMLVEFFKFHKERYFANILYNSSVKDEVRSYFPTF